MMSSNPAVERPWLREMRVAGEKQATRCDIQATPPPRVAVCIAGAARAMATPLVLASLRHHLLHPLFGADGLTNGSRVFMQLKAEDSEKQRTNSSSNEKSFSSYRENVTKVWHAIHDAAWQEGWLPLEEAVIITGKNSVVIDRAVAKEVSDQIALVTGDAALWKSYRATVCADPEDAAGGKCCQADGHTTETNNEQRLLLNHLGLKWCAGAILRSEARRGQQYDVVMYQRPDLVWWKPMHPHCAWNWRTELLSCDFPACDMAWVAPRHYAMTLLNQAEIHRDCTWQKPQKRPNSFLGRHDCCSSSEYLLFHARSNVSSDAKRGSPMRTNRRMSDILRHGHTFSVLRRTVYKGERDSVCERVMAKQYENSHQARKHQLYYALEAVTGTMLRTLFRNSSVEGISDLALCREAMGLGKVP
mmetsp:Transcript_29095/g.61134  ORF Transcript_29095/g.61134 Transcript_29095/m.61134 type:complete len:417 (+) Transcript_29095:170-1420(+)